MAESHDESEQSHPLLAAGWCQGVTFDAPGASYSLNVLSAEGVLEQGQPRRVRQKERLILISHACDIKSGDEAYVEALICKNLNPSKEILGRWDQNSPRYFIVDPDAAWVADASYRIKLEKQVLSTLSHYGCAMDDLRQYRFVEWLTRRYDRPTVPDHIYERLHAPVVGALKDLHATQSMTWTLFNIAVNEIRVSLPVEQHAPYTAGIVYITIDTLTAEQADAIYDVHRLIVSVVDSQVLINEPPVILELDEVPFGILRRTQPLILDYPSWEDDAASPTWLVATQ